MVRTGVGLRGWNQADDTGCHLIGVAKQDRIVGIALRRIASIDHLKVMLSTAPRRHLVEHLQVVGVDLAVHEQDAPASLNLLEHQEARAHGFADTRLPPDVDVPHEVVVCPPDRLARVDGIT